MLATNKEQKIRQIIERQGKNGWLRVQACANEYAKDPITGKTNPSLETDFYRVRKRIDKGKVESLKLQLLPGNVSYIGLSSADPEVLNEFISEDKKASKNLKTGMGFFEWRDRVAERKRLEREQKAKRPTGDMIRLLAFQEQLRNHGVLSDKEVQDFKDLLASAGIDIKSRPSSEPRQEGKS